MSLGRADTTGGLRPVLRAVIILTAIVLVILVFAPTVWANQVSDDQPLREKPAGGLAGVTVGTWSNPDAAHRQPADERATNRTVRPDKQCFTSYREQGTASTGIMPASTPLDQQPLDQQPADWQLGDQQPANWQFRARDAGYAPCGQPSPFDPYGLGSLIWRGPDWGDPMLGHRT